MKDKTLEAIGTILDDSFQKDAVHFAVLPVIVDEDHLWPATPLRFVHGSTTHVVAARGKKYVGISDPFLDHDTHVKKGDRIFMFMLPGSITGLRHDWSHPALEPQPKMSKKREALEWLELFADEHNTTYEELIMQAHDALQEKDGSLTFGVDLNYEMVGKFWENYELATGEELPEEDKRPGFSCAC